MGAELEWETMPLKGQGQIKREHVPVLGGVTKWRRDVPIQGAWLDLKEACPQPGGRGHMGGGVQGRAQRVPGMLILASEMLSSGWLRPFS